MKNIIVVLSICLLGFVQMSFTNTALVSPIGTSQTIHKPLIAAQNPSDKEVLRVLIVVIVSLLGLSFLGIHRVVMGGSPWLILFYILTFGGFLGILPFMDTIRIILEPEHYRHNHHPFAALGFMSK